MSKFLLSATYTQEGTSILLTDGGSKRLDALTAAIESVGGSLEAFHYAFGDVDLYMVVEVPDDTTAAALSMRMNAAGILKVKMTKLIDLEAVDAAIAKQVAYPTGA